MSLTRNPTERGLGITTETAVSDEETSLRYSLSQWGRPVHCLPLRAYVLGSQLIQPPPGCFAAHELRSPLSAHEWVHAAAAGLGTDIRLLGQHHMLSPCISYLILCLVSVAQDLNLGSLIQYYD
jgi:hypothetical protein